MNDLITRMEQEGVLDARASERVRALWSEGTPLDEALLAEGEVPEPELLRYLAGEFGLAFVDLEDGLPSKDFVAKFPARILLKHGLLPLEEREDAGPGSPTVVVATSRVFDNAGPDALRLATGKQVQTVLAPSGEIDRCAKRLLGLGADTLETMDAESMGAAIQVMDRDADEDLDLARAAEDASIIRFVNQVLTEAIEQRATDVHFEPFERDLRLRYRVDGVLQEASVPPQVKRYQSAIVSRLKILSRLDIAEKRIPQDGRIRLKVAGRDIDVRVSVIPMLHGEAVVLRLLDRSSALFGLEQLGMSAEDRATIQRILGLPHGIVLVTGPTGSGKTTTLYAALSCINDVQRKIITIEDPIEYHLRGINQIQVSEKAGLTFARGLRSILRHDPDVILVGEIRDRDTAQIAVQASLTGHLVFSTLHTNDAPGALTRLVDMGVEPYLVASSLEAVLAQRLVRLICAECREPRPASAADMALLARETGQKPPRLDRGRGCRSCQATGYRGRTGIFEVMPISQAIRAAMLAHGSAGDIRRIAITEEMKSLRLDGWRHVLEGRTTIAEVLRVSKGE